MEANTWYWYCHPVDGYVPVQLKSSKATGHVFKTASGEQVQVDLTTELPKAHESSLQVYDNLVAIQELSEPAILHNLRQRFETDTIYTSLSSILISVNPFKQLPIYSANVMADYRVGLAARKTMPPHVYSLADGAFRSLATTNKNQAVIISGESGAGKTECTKLVLQYMAEMSGQGSNIEQQVLEANPILEAFGNAKTVRNNNSSRFGKWVEVYFDDRLRISGAKINSYLLEKSRIVSQAPNERNYHIFFQLLAGVGDTERRALLLDDVDPASFALTRGTTAAAAAAAAAATASNEAKSPASPTFPSSSSSSSSTLANAAASADPYVVPGMDDCEEFQRTLHALSVLKVDKKEVDEIVKTTAGLMFLSNVAFAPVGEGSTVTNPQVCINISHLSLTHFLISASLFRHLHHSFVSFASFYTLSFIILDGFQGCQPPAHRRTTTHRLTHAAEKDNGTRDRHCRQD